MSRRIMFRRIARVEYGRSKRWYEKQRRGLGKAFEAGVETTLETISKNPDRYPIAEGDVRIAPVARFPFGVHYRIRSNLVVVIAVFHQSRDLSEWRSRT